MKKPAQVVWIYDREDEFLAREVIMGTDVLEAMGLINSWTCFDVLPGQPWRQMIEEHLKDADVIILGLSSRLLAHPDQLWQLAFNISKEKSIVLIPFLLRATYLPDNLRQLALYPDGEKALYSLDDRFKAITQFTERLRDIVAGASDGPSSPGTSRPNGNILHLSDLHFQPGKDDAKLLFQQLATHLLNQKIEHLSGLIVSGDVTQAAQPEEFDAAEHFISLLMDKFKFSAERLVIVPGNHDIDWIASQKAYDIKRKMPESKLDPGKCVSSGDYYEERNDTLYDARLQNFSDFYQRIKGITYPLQANHQFSVSDFSDLDLCILGFNSAWEIDHHFRSRASINSYALMDCLFDFPKSRKWKIAVFHHPLDSEENSRIVDTAFMEHLSEHQFRVILHGHIHKTQSHQYNYDHVSNGRKIEIVSSGTFGAAVKDWQPGFTRQYNLLQLDGNKLTVSSRRQQRVNGTWDHDPRWRMGPNRDPSSSFTIEL